MRTIAINLYQFGELSDEAKGKALQELYNIAEYDLHSENRQTLKAIEKAFKLERFDWEYDVYSSRYSFIIPHDFKQGLSKKAVNRLFTTRLNDGFWLTESFKSTFMAVFKKHGDIKAALDRAIDETLKQCSKDMECYFSEESLAEHATINEYEFSEDGSLV